MSRRLISIKVFCCGVVYLLCQVTFSDAEVTLVTRNVTDSFRIGSGCLKNESVCTFHQASCQDDGCCLCDVNNPHFRNPITVLGTGSLSYGSSYGCITNQLIALSNSLLGQSDCQFKPFQVIPNDQEEAATKFVHNNPTFVFKSCNFTNLEAKYINNKTRSMVVSVNETYVDLNTSERILHFQWRKSVLKLQGLIITINLDCTSNKGKITECLQAKVLGTWRSSSAVKPTNAVVTTKSSNSDLTSIPTKKITWTTTASSNAVFSSTLTKITSTTVSSKAELHTTTGSTTLSPKSNQSSESSCTVIIAILIFLIDFLLLLNLVFGFCFLKHRRKRIKEQRTNSKEMSRTSPNVPDVVYEEPQQGYETVQGNALVGTSMKDMKNGEGRSPISAAYENPSAQDYTELNNKRRESEHTYQGLVRASERGDDI